MSSTTLERESREGKATLQIERLESGDPVASEAWDRFVNAYRTYCGRFFCTQSYIFRSGKNRRTGNRRRM